MKDFSHKKLAPRKICAIVLLSILLAMLALPMTACGGVKPGKKETTIYIATDIHLFSNNLIGENNQVYLKDKFLSDGRIQEYDYQLVKALVDEVNAEKPEFLILTGDLSFNGERDSHLELVKMLKEVNSNTKVLVIPGNHDVYSLDAVSVKEDKIEAIEGITSEEFREIYSDFGYSGAYSYDENSLSYIYELDDDKWVLMLDTTQSKYNKENGSAIVGGCVEEATMHWLEEKLRLAKEKGISVISFTHHNLMIHNELFKSRYTLYNYEQVMALYAKYGVSLNFSGHLHVQSIKGAEVDGRQIYDISGGSLLDYGNRYGTLEIYDNCYSYESHMVNAKSYVENLRDYSFDVFCRKYYNKTLWTYQSKLDKEKAEEVTELLSEINTYYFDGDYEQIHKLVKKNKKLIKLIKENTAAYDSSYIKSIIEVPKENQHYLLIER